MIVEHARIAVRPGQGEGFERAIALALETILPRAKGFGGLVLHRCVELPDQYVCLLEWDTLINHTQGFREGPLFAEWRALVGPHFAGPPAVLHYESLQLDPKNTLSTQS